MVGHGHFYVNGHKVDVPSYQAKPGDKITVKPGEEIVIREIAATAEGIVRDVPQWLSVDNERLTAKVLRLPEPGEVRLPFEIDMAKVIELYTR